MTYYTTEILGIMLRNARCPRDRWVILQFIKNKINSLE